MAGSRIKTKIEVFKFKLTRMAIRSLPLTEVKLTEENRDEVAIRRFKTVAEFNYCIVEYLLNMITS